MRLEKIKEAFLAFFHRQPFPSYLQWRDITEEVAAIISNTTPNT